MSSSLFSNIRRYGLNGHGRVNAATGFYANNNFALKTICVTDVMHLVNVHPDTYLLNKDKNNFI